MRSAWCHGVYTYNREGRVKLKHTAIDGRWGVCMAGRLFKITGKVGDKFVGKGLDGKPAQSLCPTALSKEEGQRLDELIAKESHG